MNFTIKAERNFYEGEEESLTEALLIVEDGLTDLGAPIERCGECVVGVGPVTKVSMPFENNITVEHAMRVVDGFEEFMSSRGFDFDGVYRNSWIDGGFLIFAVQYEPKSNKESLEDQVMRLAKFIMSKVPGGISQNEGAIDCSIHVIEDLQTSAHAMWGLLTTISEACGNKDEHGHQDLELIKEISESRNLYYVGDIDGLHRVTDRGVISDVEPDRGSQAIVHNLKAVELLSTTVDKKEVIASLTEKMEKLQVEDGDLLIIRYDDGWIPTANDLEQLVNQIFAISNKKVQLISISVDEDIERLDASVAVKLLSERSSE